MSLPRASSTEVTLQQAWVPKAPCLSKSNPARVYSISNNNQNNKNQDNENKLNTNNSIISIIIIIIIIIIGLRG